MTSAATTHVTPGKGSPRGAEDPDTTYLRASGKFPFAPSLTASPRHPPVWPPGTRAAQVARPPRGGGPRPAPSIGSNYTRHLFQPCTAPPASPAQQHH